ncbi:hypothetical protein EXIGLDRAFT_833722 [Exidia glandulosa HHB12029]|uniref:Uncharacterized protein n=1 Tax=Exidia glandulosa HHB12029 TaxID=1314781 RepID=A0A165KHY3_EXIGL|nr:hypothetical protein EXIGLDRAFT_833722 [Exidia glandulosa HHB12029]
MVELPPTDRADVDADSLLRVEEDLIASAKQLKVNRDTALSLSTRIHQLVQLVVEALETDPLVDHWQKELKDFEDLIVEMRRMLEDFACRGYMSQFLSRNRDAGRLTLMYLRVKDSFEALKLRAGIAIARPLEATALPELVYR